MLAPSLFPVRARGRVKADRRDEFILAKLHRAGELTAVWGPDSAHEAMRGLVWARATAMRDSGKGAPTFTGVSAEAWLHLGPGFF